MTEMVIDPQLDLTIELVRAPTETILGTTPMAIGPVVILETDPHTLTVTIPVTVTKMIVLDRTIPLEITLETVMATGLDLLIETDTVPNLVRTLVLRPPTIIPKTGKDLDLRIVAPKPPTIVVIVAIMLTPPTVVTLVVTVPKKLAV